MNNLEHYIVEDKIKEIDIVNNIKIFSDIQKQLKKSLKLFNDDITTIDPEFGLIKHINKNKRILSLLYTSLNIIRNKNGNHKGKYFRPWFNYLKLIKTDIYIYLSVYYSNSQHYKNRYYSRITNIKFKPYIKFNNYIDAYKGAIYVNGMNKKQFSNFIINLDIKEKIKRIKEINK